MKEIPANVVLNKGITGCGATTLGIKQPGCTILAMPFVGLIQNKEKQHDNLLGVYGEGDKIAEIEDYLKEHPEYKIATTYESLQKVCDALELLGHNPYEEAHLLVDE